MSTYTIPTTELDAVNELLASIKESPITSLADAAEQSADATIARSKLHLASRSVQARGWVFNTDLCYPLSPDDTDQMTYVPAGFLKANFDSVHDKGRYVVRGRRVYDRIKHTYFIEQVVYADIAIILDYDDLPQAAKDLVTKIATRAFQQFILGEAGDVSFTTRDIETAQVTLENTESDIGDFNMLNESTLSSGIANRNTPRR